jgi:hypothetical protein
MAGSKLKHDLTQKRFDYFRALHRDPSTTRDIWICQCDCGNTFPARSSDLRANKTTSCGCQRHATSVGTRHRVNHEDRGQFNF